MCASAIQRCASVRLRAKRSAWSSRSIRTQRTSPASAAKAPPSRAGSARLGTRSLRGARHDHHTGEGVGLGLAVARGFVTAMGGTIQIDETVISQMGRAVFGEHNPL